MKNRIRTASLYLMTLLYFGAGINHFINPEFYEKMMPSYIPCATSCIALSGICEIVFAGLLFPVTTRKISAWLIIAMLMVFFIIHIQMLVDYWNTCGLLFWIAVIRIPLQFVLIKWAYFFTKNPQPK